MAKKGGPQSLQFEINNDEDWKHMLQRSGLVVIDVYTGWCGPCIGMVGNLKKVKLDIGSDYLHLAIAKSDEVTALKRFSGHSEPTWMFVGSGHLLRVFYGADAPQLSKIITHELHRELKAINGELQREFCSFDELTPDEIEKEKEMALKKAKDVALEEQDLSERKIMALKCTLERIAQSTPNMTVVVYFPQIIEEPEEENGRRKCPAIYKLMGLYDQINVTLSDQLECQLTSETLREMLFDSGYEMPEAFQQGIFQRPVIASQLVDHSLSPKLLLESRMSHFAGEEAPRSIKLSDFMNVIEQRVHGLLFGPEDDTEKTGVAYQFVAELDEDTHFPGMWTPPHALSKAAALRILFPSVIESMEIKEEKLPPPSVVMIFDANKAHEVLDTAEQFAEDVLHVAYFDGTQPGVAKRVARTVYELEKKGPAAVREAKMVVALKKTRSDPMMTLAQLGPVYISTDEKEGILEVQDFFPPRVEIEEVIDPWGPPPPPSPREEGEVFDEEGNLWKEDWVENEDGETMLIRRMIRRADGTSVLEGEEVQRDEEGPGGEEEEEGMDYGVSMSEMPSLPELPPETPAEPPQE